MLGLYPSLRRRCFTSMPFRCCLVQSPAKPRRPLSTTTIVATSISLCELSSIKITLDWKTDFLEMSRHPPQNRSTLQRRRDLLGVVSIASQMARFAVVGKRFVSFQRQPNDSHTPLPPTVLSQPTRTRCGRGPCSSMRACVSACVCAGVTVVRSTHRGVVPAGNEFGLALVSPSRTSVEGCRPKKKNGNNASSLAASTIRLGRRLRLVVPVVRVRVVPLPQIRTDTF
mmetsp:Transcript_2653/g.7339  ORF Transcript_2653/g.7339 Transcript_2653/m.7339 type:complete len:227 (+) Transcript_2653:40-720(+)